MKVERTTVMADKIESSKWSVMKIERSHGENKVNGGDWVLGDREEGQVS